MGHGIECQDGSKRLIDIVLQLLEAFVELGLVLLLMGNVTGGQGEQGGFKDGTDERNQNGKDSKGYQESHGVRKGWLLESGIYIKTG